MQAGAQEGRAELRRRTVPALAFAAAMLAGAGAAGAQTAPGITAKEVHLGGVMALSGPVRFVSEPMEKAMRAVFNDVNARGGIHGRQIKWSVEDDAYQPARTITGVKKFIERDGAFAVVGLLGAPTTSAALPYSTQAKVPVVSINGMPSPPPPYGFGIQASYADLMYQLTKHLVTAGGVKKLGFFFQNDDLGEFGRVGMARALKELGAEKLLIADVGFERGAVEYTTQVLRLRDSGAEAVIAMGSVPTVAAAIKQAAAVSYRPMWATYAIGGSAAMHQLVGDLVDGITFAMETDIETSTAPGIVKAKAIVEKSYPGLRLDYNAMLAYSAAEFVVKVIEAAGPDLTREKFVRAAEALGAYQGDVMALSFSPAKHTGAASIGIYRWKGGSFAAVAERQAIGDAKP